MNGGAFGGCLVCARDGFGMHLGRSRNSHASSRYFLDVTRTFKLPMFVAPLQGPTDIAVEAIIAAKAFMLRWPLQRLWYPQKFLLGRNLATFNIF